MKTATVDLSGESKQYAGTIYIGGTHPAANGGAWMTAVLGFGGLQEGKEVTANPRLPKKWQGMKFKTHYQGKRYQIEISHTETKVSPLS